MEPTSERSRVRRLAERGRYDRTTIDRILDEALICHVSFGTDEGPVVIPTIHARIDDTLYLHGSPGSRMLRSTVGASVCVAATIVDGIVAARSLFHHSLNYRSVVVFGTVRLVDDASERQRAFEAITEHILPGRWEEARRPSAKEDRATRILAIDIDEASAKIRTGPPGDDDEDLGSGIWAGVVPLQTTTGEPIPSPDLEPGVDVPPSVRSLGR